MKIQTKLQLYSIAWMIATFWFLFLEPPSEAYKMVPFICLVISSVYGAAAYLAEAIEEKDEQYNRADSNNS
jgi:hypothetical protein